MACCFGGGGTPAKYDAPESDASAAAPSAKSGTNAGTVEKPVVSGSKSTSMVEPGESGRVPGASSSSAAAAARCSSTAYSSRPANGQRWNSGEQGVSNPTSARSHMGHLADLESGAHASSQYLHALADTTTPSVDEILRLNLAEVKVALQKLASVNSTPSLGFNEAVELLCVHLGVAMCSITGYTDHCTSFVLLADYGLGSAEMEKTPVLHGSGNSHAMLLDQPTCLHCKAANDEEAAELPSDFQVLYKAGLRSFLALSIATDHEVLGALTIAREDAEGFAVDWWEPVLGCLSMGLLLPMRNEQTYHMCRLMKQLDVATDYTVLIHQLLVGAQTLLLKAKNIATGCRLALIDDDRTKALVFEQHNTGEDRMDQAPEIKMDPQLHVTEIEMESTLLLDSTQKGRARFVSDCASYIQSCMKPATDIFISGHEMVASIVVLPLIYQGKAFGGFYVSLQTVSNFQNIRDMLMGFVENVVLVLQRRLSGSHAQIRDEIMSKSNVTARPHSPHLPPSLQDADGSASQDHSITSARAVVQKRNNTEAMLRVLQNDIRKTIEKNMAHEWVEELVLTEVLGKGGFGIVYKGTWKGSPAAVKVMYARQHERQAMKDALEMALLTSVSHPFIIQVYSCFTDMVEDTASSNNAQHPTSAESSSVSDGRLNVRFRKLQPTEDRGIATCNVLIMEYCDRATLRHAMKKWAFHKRLSNVSIAVNLSAIVQVLVEVAQAIQHLHSLKLIHCDIKPENVLLKSDPSKLLGFQTKLSDFGLAKILRENCYIVNQSGSGTVTHLAPELFLVGSKVTTAVDAFSFGVMMWEMYTGQRAYGGMGRDAIIDRVNRKQARPEFPEGVPNAYSDLAKCCWASDPTTRPTFVVILDKLGDLLVSVQATDGLAGLRKT